MRLSRGKLVGSFMSAVMSPPFLPPALFSNLFRFFVSATACFCLDYSHIPNRKAFFAPFSLNFSPFFAQLKVIDTEVLKFRSS